MSEIAPLLLPFILLLASGLGWRMQRALSERHRTRETTEAIRLVLSMLVTFSALVLGLLTNSAKAHFDRFGTNMQNYSIDLITMDQRLREYGPPAQATRAMLRSYTAAAIADTWPDEPAPSGSYPLHPGHIAADSTESLRLGAMLLDVDREVATLTPETALQHALTPVLAARMAQTVEDRWILVASGRSTLSWPFIMVMTGWLVLVFAVFGVSSPGNTVVYVVIASAALSLSVTVWLIVELDAPLTGLIEVHGAALREALTHMDLPL